MAKKKTKVLVKRPEREFDSLQEWHAEAEKLFGTDANKWRFVCPACNTTFSVQDFLDVGGDEKACGEECIGRYTQEKGCNWAAYGLFDICNVHIRHNGKRFPVFDFAREEDEKCVSGD